MSRANRSAANRSAFARQAGPIRSVTVAAARTIASGRSPSKNAPVSPSITESRAPPAPRATTGQPQAWASTATMPKSSTWGKIRQRARR
jgi:hypothetical protein